MDFLKETVKGLIPTKEEYKKLNEIVARIENKIKIKNAVVELGGSGRKNTWIKGNHDIDIYVKFNLKEYSKKDISKILGNELRKNFKINVLHGSRDYYQIIIENYTIEAIPIIDIKKVDDALNITDISPFHCKYIRKHDKSNDIRLAKAFCRANNCYGAESYIGGFSGYALEILTIHYGGFLRLIRNASKWKEKTLIGDKKTIDRLNESKKTSLLILIDPVDTNRNAAAALSSEKYRLFINACNNFLRRPSNNFFIEKKFDENLLFEKNLDKKIVKITAKPLDGKKDVVGAKLLKCFNYIKKQLELNEFKIWKSEWHWDNEAKFYFVFEKKELSKIKKHYGPPINEKEHAKGFIKKWGKQNVKKEGRLLYVCIKRQFLKPGDYVMHMIKNDKNLANYARKLEAND